MEVLHFEPTEFEAHVKLFDRTFKCHPLSREEMSEKLNGFLTEDELLDYLMGLQARALFGLRLALLVEETGEWCEAVLKDKPRETQEDEVADIEYVLHGLNDTMGYSANEARARVAIKNQKKITNADKMKLGDGGKVIKPTDNPDSEEYVRD